MRHTYLADTVTCCSEHATITTPIADLMSDHKPATLQVNASWYTTLQSVKLFYMQKGRERARICNTASLRSLGVCILCLSVCAGVLTATYSGAGNSRHFNGGAVWSEELESIQIPSTAF